MSSRSMIHQLLQENNGKIDQVILTTDHLELYGKDPDQVKVPALVINNHLPLTVHIDPPTIETLRGKGIEYYPSGRTGMPAMVAAEDGLAIPGTVLASTDKNLLELAVFGTYVLLLDDQAMLELLGKGHADVTPPEVMNIVLSGQAGEWTGGIDIALYLEKYFDCPKDKMLEIHGEGLNNLPLNERINLARTLVGLGYEKLLFQVDDAVMAFLQDRSEGEGRFYFADAESDKDSVIHIELQKIHPMVAWKEKGTVKIGPLTDKDGVDVNNILIGGDTACRFADIQEGLKLIRYRPMVDSVTGIILPGSQLVFGDLLDMGVAGILTEIGFDILPSSCLELLTVEPKGKQVRMGTSMQLLHSGSMVANALSCFSAAMTGRVTHPLELESILKNEEHQHEHDTH